MEDSAYLLDDPAELHLKSETFEHKTAVQVKKLLNNPDLFKTVDSGCIPSQRVRFRHYPPGLTSISNDLPSYFASSTQKCHPFSDLQPESIDGHDLSDTVEVDVKLISIKDAARIGKNGLLNHLLSLSSGREIFDFDSVRAVTEAKWNVFYGRSRFRLIRFLTRVLSFEHCISMMTRHPIKSLRESRYFMSLVFLTVVSSIWSLVVDIIHLIRFVLEDEVSSEEAQGGSFSQTMLGNFYFCKNVCKKMKTRGWFWFVISIVIEIYVSAVISLWFVCVCLVRHAKNLCTPLLSLLVLYIILTREDGIPDEKMEMDYWIVTLFLIIGRLQLIRAFYFEMSEPGPLLMFTADFFHEIFSFGMLMIYILSTYVLIVQLLYTATIRGASSDQTIEHCPGHPDLKDYCRSPSSYATLFFAMLGEFDPHVFDVLPGSIRTLAYILLISLLIVQSIFMLNILVSILGDGFDRTKANEKATLAYHRALYMRQMEREMFPWERKKKDDKLKGFVYSMECKDGSGHHSEWTGRVGTIKHCIHSAIGTLSDNLEERLTGFDTKQRNQIDRLNKNLMRIEAEQQERSDLQNEQMERLHSSIKEMERTMLTMMQEIRDLKGNH